MTKGMLGRVVGLHPKCSGGKCEQIWARVGGGKVRETAIPLHRLALTLHHTTCVWVQGMKLGELATECR